MAKLKRHHYIEIIDRTINGESRTDIAKDLPVDQRRVSKIICDLVDGLESDYLRETLGDYFDSTRKDLLRKRMNPGRSRKIKFMEHVERTARDDKERQRMIESYETGYSGGYNLGRNSKGDE